MSRCLMVAWVLCAWVMWQHTEFRHDPAPVGVKVSENWGIGEVFETRQACEQQLDADVAARLAEKPTLGYKADLLKRGLAVTTLSTTEEDRAKNKVAGWPKVGIVTTQRCLPSGTDPRPRGKE